MQQICCWEGNSLVEFAYTKTMRLEKGKEELRTSRKYREDWKLCLERAFSSKEESDKGGGENDRKIRFVNEESSWAKQTMIEWNLMKNRSAGGANWSWHEARKEEVKEWEQDGN